MLYQLIITVGLVTFMLNLILNLRSLKAPRSDSTIAEPAPLVSILVPARDEELNIEACLESLKNQDYPNYEVLVLDDNSVDTNKWAVTLIPDTQTATVTEANSQYQQCLVSFSAGGHSCLASSESKNIFVNNNFVNCFNNISFWHQ